MITFSSLQTDYHLAAPAITQEIAQKDPEEEFYSEGGESYQIHLSRERDPRIISLAKKNFREKNSGRLYCEVCKFDFFRTYGDRGKNYAEGHHIRPVSEMDSQDVTQVADIRIVCSNCHRMLHRGSLLTLEELRRLL